MAKKESGSKARNGGADVSAVPTKSVEVGGKVYGKKAVTLPFTLLQDTKSIRCVFDGPIHAGKVDPNKKDKAGKQMDPMQLAPITNLDSGEQTILICSAVVQSNMAEKYPENAYVGKAFEITCTGKVPGKRYKGYTIYELVAE